MHKELNPFPCLLVQVNSAAIMSNLQEEKISTNSQWKTIRIEKIKNDASSHLQNSTPKKEKN